MSSYRKTQNQQRRLREEILKLKESITRAKESNKNHFVIRLRMMLEDKKNKLKKLTSYDSDA